MPCGMLEISPGFPHPLPPNSHGIFHSARQPPSSSLPLPPSRSSLTISSCLSAANTVGGDSNATANSSSSPTVAKLGARKRPHITMPGGGRPPKRPSDQGCSPTTSPPSPAKAKLPRLDRGPEDFSSVVKSKLQSYTRTGQACDRCKVRKIRCDALPEGCSHCASQRLECYVTDRVTGRTERRGYLQELEREKSDMLNHIRQLEELVNSKGINIKPWSWSAFGKPAHPPGMLVDTTGAPINVSNTDGPSWTKSEAPAKAKNLSLSATRSSVLLPRPGESHIGVFQDKAPLSAVKGTQLSILGATIDVTDFDAEDMEEPAPGFQATEPFYNKSLFSFVQSVMHKQPPPPIELPSKDEAFQYSEWYFVMIFPFVPVLHKPTHMRLLARIYDEPGFKPSSAELAIVHMVLAMIYFQYGIRNREEADRRIMLNELSNKHYHWCLHTISDVIADTSVTSVQALVLMAIHARGFPKPGCASLIASYAVNKCIELNLHRESKPPGAPTNLDHELRKRAWWSALSMLVTLNGRLGRPMPLNVKEFDTGYPVPIDDEYLTEDGIVDESKIGHCHHMVGLVGFKTATMYMRMHTEIYGVRRDPASYIDTVNELDEEYRIWEENLPDDLNIAKCKPGEQVFALYAQAFSLEFRFCLRHPSVCMTDDPKFIADNNRICEETARALLKHVEILLRLKSLDTTWYQISVYCAVMFTILVAHWERRYETTPAEVSQLKEDADTWLAIITEICLLVGSTSGERLSNEIRQIITRTIAWIERDMGRAPGTVSPNQPQNGGQQQQTPQIKQEPSQFTHISIPPATAAVVNNSSSMAASTIAQNNGSNAYYGSNGAAQTTPYPAQLAYQPQSATTTHTGNGMSYDPHDQASYLYAATAAAAAISQGNSAGVSEPHETNPLVAFASQATSHVGSNTNTWHDWTAAIADSQDRYSANALLNIAAGPARDGGLGLDQSGGAHHGHGPAANGLGVSMGGSGAHTQWPLILFHDANGAVSSG